MAGFTPRTPLLNAAAPPDTSRPSYTIGNAPGVPAVSHRVAALSLILLTVPVAGADKPLLLKPARVFDGETSHDGWVGARPRRSKIEAAGPGRRGQGTGRRAHRSTCPA